MPAIAKLAGAHLRRLARAADEDGHVRFLQGFRRNLYIIEVPPRSVMSNGFLGPKLPDDAKRFVANRAALFERDSHSLKLFDQAARSEERRVGKEGDSTGR